MYKLKTDAWYLERVVFLFAGIFIVTSLLLGLWLSRWFFYFTFLVGGMQIFFSLTGLCPMAILLEKLGIKPRLG